MANVSSDSSVYRMIQQIQDRLTRLEEVSEPVQSARELNKQSEGKRPMPKNLKRPHHEPLDDGRFKDPYDREYRRPTRDERADPKFKPFVFTGKEESEVYLEWERQMDANFECYSLTNRRKIHYVAAHLAEDAIMWWEREERNRRRAHYEPVSTWKEMKILMRKRYVSRHFLRELQYRFDNIVQGDKAVEDYFGEFEQLLAYLRIEDNEEDLMAHFLEGLKDRIARKVNPHGYRDLRHLVHTTIQVERQMNKKPSKNGCQRMPTPTLIHRNFSDTGDPIKAQNLDARKDETILYTREVHTRGEHQG
ncbi:PREDICTED: uncharacterized protein LOC104801735 isoform X2 [Tarenaya hassleriana]|uniref:uncharacterized protein LOC104801735 isoform X2 n=1 Tax=Tarenaya hassleriana TaxID=28532 RepID=UPI00053C90CE|nr:PREDICTED: uncharacterized protein LOC104801735 isoform X2 [Tarenaya hassleriana]